MNITPLFKQYLQLKEKSKDAILLFRVGDFYETYFEDARIFAEINSVVLTKRTLPDGKAIPMAGVPFHSVDNYIKNLLNAGYKVAIAEQLEQANNKGNLVKRDIVEIITPGTITSYNYLDDKKLNFLTIIDYFNSSFYILSVDVSILEGYISISNSKNFFLIVDYFNPSEIVFSHRVDEAYRKYFNKSIVLEDKKYSYEQISNFVIDQNSMFLLEKNGFIPVFGLLINYLEKNMLINNENSLKFRFKTFSDDLIILDSSTIRSLEILDGKESLVNILDHTSTSFGARKFKVFITQPLKNVDKINERLDTIEFLVHNTDYIIRLREKMKKIPDLERILSKFSIYKYHLKDFIMVKNFFINTYSLIEELNQLSNLPSLLSKIISSINKSFSNLETLFNTISTSIDDQIREFDHFDLIIKEGFDQKMDSYIYLIKNNENWLKKYEEDLRNKTGIKSLKISYNQIFGYYIEVTKANLNLVPPYFERKQTLVNSERFVTNELKEFEANLAEAISSIEQLQQNIIKFIIANINENRIYIMELIDNLALLDILLSLAYSAVVNNYNKPFVFEGKQIVLRDARHPIYEKFFDNFVPNDLYMDENKFFIILTGPNMGGKSTFLKTVALNVLLAQVGSFIPCREASIGIVDGIFTRIGANDDIIRNRSTFMLEMLETAYILDNCTENSLVIMDEIGRGTSTYDGMAIAWAICQYLSSKIKARSILATHFHQLANLEKINDHIVNYHVKVLEEYNNVHFTYKVVRGAAEKSYGIFVAKIAGIREEVINIANQVLENFEKLTGIKKVQTKFLNL